MDHLPKPYNNSFSSTERVSYVCKDEYDGGPFLSYPARHQPVYAPFLQQNVKDAQSHINYGEAIPTRDLEQFLQTWLFFGLLREFAGDNLATGDFLCAVEGIDREDSETKTRPTCYLITTTRLNEYLHRWMSETKSLSTEEAESKVRHAVDCLYTANYALYAISDNSRYNQDFDPDIRASIQCLIGTLILAAKDVAKKRSLSIHQNSGSTGFWSNAYRNSTTSAKMIQRGWCAYDVKNLFQQEYSLPTVYFFNRLDKSFSGRDHSSCWSNRCVANQIDAKTYCTLHRCESKACGSMGIDSKAFFSDTEQLSIPLLQVTLEDNDHDMGIQAVPAERGVPYVAISHVWSEGLGNTSGNALPMCQLSHIAQLVRRLGDAMVKRNALRDWKYHFSWPCTRWNRRHLAPNPPPAIQEQLEKQKGSHWCSMYARRNSTKVPLNEALFWIDSLCVPALSSNEKQKALERMESVYNDASAILVLDESLQSVDGANMTNYEMGVRVLASAWATRLWTLQESTLANEIWIQFRDGPVDLHDIWFPPNQNSTNDIVDLFERQVHTDVRQGLRNIKMGEFATYGVLWTYELLPSTSLRAVSNVEDEPFCLASLLDADVTRILNLPKDGPYRVAELWRLISEAQGVPSHMIFFSAKRLSLKGFRWAPASLLQARESLDINYNVSVSKEIGELCQDGLKVRFPGFKISLPVRQLKMNLRGKGSKFDRSHLMIRVGPRQWLNVFTLESGLRSSKESPELYDYIRAHVDSVRCITWGEVDARMQRFMDKPGDRSHSYGVIGVVEKDAGGRVVFKSFALVNVFELQRQKMTEIAYLGSQIVLEDPIMARLYELDALNNAVDLAELEEAQRVLRSRCESLTNYATDAGSRSPVWDCDASLRSLVSRRQVMGRMLDFVSGAVAEAEIFYPKNTEWIVD